MKKKNLLALLTSSMLLLSVGAVYLTDKINPNPSYSKELNWWENNCVMPDGYTSIADIISSGVSKTEYTTRGTITAIEGNSLFIQSQGKGLLVYNPDTEDTLVVGNVVDVTGTIKTYYSMVEFENASVTLYASTNPTPVVAFNTTSSTVRADLPIDGSSTYVNIKGITYNSTNPGTGKTIYFKGTNSINAYANLNNADAIRSGLSSAIAANPGKILCFRGVVAPYNTALQMRVTSMNNFYFIEEGQENVLVTSITVSPETSTIAPGGSVQLSTTVLPADATDSSVTWSTTSGASVSSTGLFSSNTEGTYTVTATANDGSGVTGSTSITVTSGSGLDYGYVIENPTQNGSILGPMYVAGNLDVPTVTYLEMIDEYGDSILIDYGDFEILIDAGQPDDMQNVMAALSDACEDHVLEMIVITHPHEDHYGGILNAADFENYGDIESITYWVDFGGYRTTAQYNNYYVPARQHFLDEGTIYYSAYEMFDGISGYPNEFMITDDVTFKILDSGWYTPYGSEVDSSNVNEASVCALLSIGNSRYFLCGDSTNSGKNGIEHNIVTNYGDTGLWSSSTYNVVKANHHCSGTHSSNSQEWIDGTMPDCVVISASIISGNQTSAGAIKSQHPNLASLARYLSYTENVYCNMVNGNITFTHNNFVNNPTMSFAGRTIDYYYEGSIVSRESERTIKYNESNLYTQLLTAK